jgi:hypothetical protein
VIVGPSLKREFNRSFEPEELSTAIVDEQPRADKWIDDICEKTLIVPIPWSGPHILDIGRIEVADVEACALSDPPQPPEHLGLMHGAIANRVGMIVWTPKEIADGPPIFPVDPTVCIANHHEVDLRLVDCVEPMNHIALSRDVGFPKDDGRACSEGLDHVGIDIGCDVDIHLPVGEVLCHEIDILKQSRVIARI